MKQTTTMLAKIVVEYDNDVLTERDAQDRWVDNASGHHVEIVAGLVDQDGDAIQPRV